MVLTIHSVEVSAQRLADVSIDIEVKLAIMTELRESIEIVQSTDYARYLSSLLPVFIALLTNTPPVFSSDAQEQKLRNTILEIIHRFPQNDCLKPFAADLMSTFMLLLRTDNEDNAVVCLKIITDLHKNYKMVLELFVQPFLDIVKELFNNMDTAIAEAFDGGDGADVVSSNTPFNNSSNDEGGVPGSTQQRRSHIPRSLFSFKVLTECPIIIALLFQLHKKFVNSNVNDLAPCVIKALALQPSQQKAAHEEAAANKTIFVGVSPLIKNRTAFSELKALQVKTVSFFAYILKSYMAVFKPHSQAIADCVVGLMKDCPPEASATRKELLVATRHICQTEFRHYFVCHIEVLLNENVMTGSGVTCREILRPLAHSVLVDLIHQIKGELNMEQLSKTIIFYSKHVQDASFSPNIQTMCAKLLLTLCENVAKLSHKDDGTPQSQQALSEGRALFIHILETITCKITSLRIAFPVYCKYYHKRKIGSSSGSDGGGPANDSASLSSGGGGGGGPGGMGGSNEKLGGRPDGDKSEDLTAVPEYDGYLDLGFNQPIRTSSRPIDSSSDLIKDIRFLLKYIIPGVKTILTYLAKFNPPLPATADAEAWKGITYGFSDMEIDIFTRIARDGLQCFLYFNIDSFDGEGHPLVKRSDTLPSPPASLVKDEKDVLDAFAGIFMSIDQSIFQEVFSCQISFFLEQAVNNPQLFAIPQYFLASVNLSPSFSGLLLRYLVSNLDKLGGPDLEYASVMLKMFKLIFMAVKSFPDKNQLILAIHMSTIITSSLKMSGKAQEPVNYFNLLRALFRAISGGRFEALYTEVLPLLPALLEGLNHLLATSQKQAMKELFVELCLTVPVRLSALLPYLSYLMRPLVIALQAGPELVSQGLRTLELCIDNFTHEFFEPIISPVIQEIMTALWGHLQPEPYNNQISQTALRILGKLGGQNRKLLKDPPSLSYKAFADGGLEASIVFKPFEEMPKVLSLNFALDTVLEVFKESKVDEFYLNKALDFLKGSLSLLFDVDPGAENLHSIFGQQIDMYMNRRKSKNSMEIDDAASNSSSGIPPSPFLDLPPVTQYKLDSHTVAINKVLVSLFYASRNQSLKEECTLLIENICRHFALMSVAAFVSGDPNGSITSSSKQPQLPPRNASSTFTKPPITLDVLLSTPATRLDGFVDAIVEVMSCDINELRNLAQSSLEIFYNTSVSFLSESDVVEDMPIFRAFASKFSASCYQPEWFRKNGGCSGIALLSGKISLSANWLLEYELEFVRALLYVLKDTSSEMTSGNVDDATKTLYHILRICNTAPSPTTAASESAILAPQQDRTSKFNSLIALLISELSSSNSFVRETIQESFSILASLTNVEVTELLSPVRDRLLTPIFAKPLRALPIPMQIGHIDAITYCLSLRPSLLSFSDELLRLLHESLALADADDQALIIGKPSQYKNATLLINLRVVCIKLLSAAMTNNEFSNPKLTSTRGRIIAMFFKSLYTKSSEVVDVAYKGLQQVLNAQHKLPKDLLQAGLRPILVNLSDHTRLSVSGLEGLARLLELLTNYFKVEIGRKLLDHMKQWALPAMLEDAACKPLSEIEEIKLIVGIVNVFHLLPAAANVFMEELVEQVLDLENRLRRYRSSPFRQPLIKFLNIYATEAVEQFYKKISTSSPHNRLFVGILGSPEATKLRQEIVKAPSSYFIAATFGAGDEDNKFELQLQGVLMMKEICKFQPEFLLDNADLLYHLRLIWKQELPLQKDNLISSQSKQVLLQSILDLFIMYCNIQSDEIDLLFDMVDALDAEVAIEQDSLKKYIYDRICGEYSSALKRSIMVSFFEMFRKPQIAESKKALIIRMLLIPILITSNSKGTFLEVVDSAIIETIDNAIWRPMSLESADVACDPSLVVELLQLTALLVQCGSQILNESKKDVIKFAWSYIKVDDITCKQAAYVVLARFFFEFTTPSKIIIQVFVALLRSHQAEVRLLVRQALDVLLPILPERIPTNANSAGTGSGLSIWVRWTRRVIIEDGHTSSQLVTIYQLITRHPSLFYDSRDAFIPQIVSSLSRLGLASVSTKETKSLTVDLAELILAWERQGESDPSLFEGFAPQTPDTPHSGVDMMHVDKKMKVGSSDATVVAPPGVLARSNSISSQPSNFREMLVTYLIRLITSTNELAQRRELVYRSISVFTDFLVLWRDVNIRFAPFERVSAMDVTDANLTSISNSLETLKVIVDAKDDAWLLSNLSSISKIIDPWMRCDNLKIIKGVEPIVYKIFGAIAEPIIIGSNPGVYGASSSPGAMNAAPEISPDYAAFIKMVDSIIKTNIQEAANTYATVAMLCSSYGQRKADLSSMYPDVVKLFQKCVRDHLTALATSNMEQTADSCHLLMMLLKLLKGRMSQMGDQRKYFLVALLSLVDKSTDSTLLKLLLSIVSEWVQCKTEAFPTAKEKANIMVKMIEFQNSSDKALFEDYLNLVADIYSDKSFLRTELAVRLEQAFLLGTKCTIPVIRSRFAKIFSNSIDENLVIRLNYVFGVQNWESISSSFWLRQALELLLDSAVSDIPIHSSSSYYRLDSIQSFFGTNSSTDDTVMSSSSSDIQKTEDIIKNHQQFLVTLRSYNMGTIFKSLSHLVYTHQPLAFSLWCQVFPICWQLVSATDRHTLVKFLIPLLAKDYHLKQIGVRTNVVQALMEGISKCVPAIQLPPQLVKYLSKTFNSWYSGLDLLESASAEIRQNGINSKDEEKIRESTLDALAELYSDIGEDDYFYGLWRRRCLFTETNSALSFEQIGLWEQGQVFFEAAQQKARTGIIPFTESEYNLWEDHWIQCSQRLQQWDILTDLSKHESNYDLLIECAWRSSDWVAEREGIQQTIAGVSDNNPRKKIYEIFNCWHKLSGEQEKAPEFQRLLDGGIQSCLKKWVSLPEIVTNTHIPLLHQFQLMVELQEACTIQTNLAATTHANLDQKNAELKSILHIWRDRLPNLWDDINIWSDLVAWRQHVFGVINKANSPLLPTLINSGSNSQSYAYRGFHETAWTINRFAHVARKHKLTDVCVNQLTKIYTLPNIEIHEAFFKLREQAKCYEMNSSEWPSGLDVVNNTNLMYFSNSQKAEFWSLKGVFFSNLQLHDEAAKAFASATQIDSALPRAWALWGQYNDRMFKETIPSPENNDHMKYAAYAVNCYMHAASLHNNGKTRKYLSRVLWLLSLDDDSEVISKAYEDFKGDQPTWYWITFIPQLLTSLSSRESRYTRQILMKLAKTFPQALHFQLRTTKEDMAALKRQALAAAPRPSNESLTSANSEVNVPTTVSESNTGDKKTTPAPASSSSSSAEGVTNGVQASTDSKDDKMADAEESEAEKKTGEGTSNDDEMKVDDPAEDGVKQQQQDGSASSEDISKENPPPASNQEERRSSTVPQTPTGVSVRRQPWEYVDEVMALLKTAFPLLALSMETMCDQIINKLKPTTDEDVYRLIVALLNDGVIQLTRDPVDNGGISATTETNLSRFADSMHPNHLKYKAAFEWDFIRTRPTLTQLVERFRNWRDKLEGMLDARPRKQRLEHFSHYLVEFEYQKFDDIEVPGQYYLLKDNNRDFVKIERFHPEVELIRAQVGCFRRLTIRGHNGNMYPFSVQHPSHRQSRREERITQLMRILNSVLERKKESRKRNLMFHLPTMIPLAPQARLVEDDPSYLSMYEMYEDHCNRSGIHKDDYIVFFLNRMRDVMVSEDISKRTKVDVLNLKTEIMEEISNRMIPDHILSNYMLRAVKSSADLWLMRKSFTNQMALITFMSYVLCIGQRHPSKFFVSKKNGNIWVSEFAPSPANTSSLYSNQEAVPFRFTPNIQQFIAPIGVEGVFTSSLMAIARSLTEPELNLEDYLSVFVKDELLGWQAMGKKPPFQDNQLRELVTANVDVIVRKAQALACRVETDKSDKDVNIPANQTILDMIAQAVNPLKLAQMDLAFMANF